MIIIRNGLLLSLLILCIGAIVKHMFVFHQNDSSAVLKPEPNLKSVLIINVINANASGSSPTKLNWRQSSTDSLLGQGEKLLISGAGDRVIETNFLNMAVIQ